MPTWGQLWMLVRTAKEDLRTSNTPVTTVTLLLAMLAVLGPEVASGESYWAYVPKPPILHPVGWGSPDHIRVLTNQTLTLGGSPDFHLYKNSSGHVNYEGKSDSLPICFSFSLNVPKGCMRLGQRVFNADTPTVDNTKPDGKGDKRRMWELWLTTLGSGDQEGRQKANPVIKKLPPKYPHCRVAFKRDSLWEGDETSPPRWLPCVFPESGVRHMPRGASGAIWDFSLSSPAIDQSEKLKTDSAKYGGYIPPIGKPVHRWYDAGWVEPTWFWENDPKDIEGQSFTSLVAHPDLFRLVAAGDRMFFKKPGAANSELLVASACVTYPYALLIGLPQLIDISKEGSIYHITCESCKLTNCIDPTASPSSAMLIVKRPPYVLLPVDIGDEPWFDDSALQTFKYASGLLRAKRFVAAIILGISALIAIITSFAVSTTALVKEMQTATFVNNLHRNITLALFEQRIIDLKLEARLNALEEVVLELGQDVANIKTRMSTRCHASYDFICVTPLPYNATENWERTKAHLLGIWNNNNVSYNIEDLTSLITEISKQHLDSIDLSGLAHSFASRVKSLNPLDWTQYFVFIGIGALLLVIVLVVFPIVFQCFANSLAQVKSDLDVVLLKKKKGGNAAPAAEMIELPRRA